MVTALEALLLTQSDKDYLGWKLAERLAFLLGKSKKQRKEIYDYIHGIYDKRSGFAHQKTKGRKEISESDIWTLQNLVASTVLELLKLRDKGYVQIQKHKQVLNLVDYIDDLKFAKQPMRKVQST